MIHRYDARRDRCGWTVFDRWTGLAVVLNGGPQKELGWLQADEMVDLLNRRTSQGDRRIYQ